MSNEFPMSCGDAFYRRNQKWLLLLLLPLCYALFFHELGARDIWDPDEDEYVLVNREMVRDGHWLYPTANGGPYGIKPPLFNWLGSAVSLVQGEVTELTSRLPSAIAATLGLFALYFLGRMLFGYRAAWISVLVLATSPLYIEFGRWIQINMISTVLLTVTMACFTWGYTNERRRTPAYLLMYAATGLGTLDMGPVNAVMPTIVIGAYLIVVKDLQHLWQMRIGWGLLVYLGIVAPWYTAASLQGGYAENLLIVTNLTRFFGEFHHSRPFYYYVQTAPAYFLPWLVFLPGALYLCFAERTREDRSRLLLPFVWVVGLFLFFSMSNTKRSEYILPIFPALALLVGYALDWALLQWEDIPVRRRFFTRPLYIALGLGAAAALVGAIYAATVSMDWLAIVLPLSALVVVGCAISYLLVRRERGMQSIVALVILVAAMVGYAAGPLVAKQNQEKSAKPFCLQINEYLGPGETLKTYRFYKAMYGVYTERFVEVAADQEKLARWFASEEPVYVVTEEEDYLEVKESFPLPIHVVLRASVDGKSMLLISNLAPAATEGAVEKGEIKLVRQAAAIADAALEKVCESLYVGINELEIAGIGELEMRRRGSEFHRPVTGSSEIASGYRSWYAVGGCTPPTDKLVQRGESLLIDMHPTYKRYYSDLSHNYIIGKPSLAQRKLADANLSVCETLVASLKAGSTIGDVFKKVSDELSRSDYRRYTLPGFGHGLGVVGHEWHPPINDSNEVRDLVLQEDVVEVAAMVINVPNVGGMRLECPVRVTPSGGEMLTTTPLELTVLDG